MRQHLKTIHPSAFLDGDALAQLGKTAERERRRLLDEHPELRPFQEEIDRCLAGAGSQANRLAVMAVMLEAKLKELQEQVLRLDAVGKTGGLLR